jgi:hypothetical protein
MIRLRILAAVVLVGLLAACGGGGSGGGAAQGGETFSIDITGDLTLTLSPGDYSANFTKDDTAAPLVAHVLWFGSSQQGRAFTIIFYGAQPPAAGTFQLSDGLNTDDGAVSALLVDNSGESIQTFIPGSGTVTLTQAGPTYSGSFELTLKGGAFGAGPGAAEQAITVKGTFSGVSAG